MPRRNSTIDIDPTATLLTSGVHAASSLAPSANGFDVERLVSAINREMRATVQRYGLGPAEFWDMPSYHLGWTDLGEPEPIPGKRLRPLLVLLSTSAAGGDWTRALPLAAAVELLHGFSLVHDDIQDSAALRRGRKSVWAKWGVGHAINAGDTLFALAHLAVQQGQSLSAEQRLTALDLLDRACIRLGEGQYLDMHFERHTPVSLEEYMSMVEGKTAALTSLAAEFGALAAEADEGERAALREYGTHLGVAFQVCDDILGIKSELTETGKTNSDIARRKKTLPVVFGLTASPELRQVFERTTVEEIDTARVIELLESCGAVRYAEKVARKHVSAALDHLRSIHAQSPAAVLLANLALGVLPRGGWDSMSSLAPALASAATH